MIQLLNPADDCFGFHPLFYFIYKNVTIEAVDG